MVKQSQNLENVIFNISPKLCASLTCDVTQIGHVFKQFQIHQSTNIIWSNTYLKKQLQFTKTERKGLLVIVANMNLDKHSFFPVVEEKFNIINVRLKNG